MQRSGQRNRNEKSLILAPIHAGFIPRYPGPSASVDCNGGVRLEFGAGRQRMQGRKFSVLVGTEVDVVITLIIGVPGDVSGAIGPRGHGRLPVISGRFADPDL